jgi:hypothetical protein
MTTRYGRPEVRRREFVGLVGGAAAWLLAAGAQQRTRPVIGFLASRSPEALERGWLEQTVLEAGV